MWNRGGRSSALERAQTQLSGRRITKSAAERRDVPEHYETKGTYKTPGYPGYMDLSDLSSESAVSSEHRDDIIGSTGKRLGREDPPPPESIGAGGGGSRFLKKAPPPPVAASSQSPALSRTQAQPSAEPRYVASAHRSSQSVALSRLAIIEDRIRKQSRDWAPVAVPDKGTKPAPQEDIPLPLSAQSSTDLSIKRKNFLKKTVTAATTPTVAPKGPDATLLGSSKAAPPLGSSKALPIRVVSGGVTLDSDEEDMRKLLGGSFELSDDSFQKERRVSPQKTTRKSFIKGSQKASPTPPLAARPSSSVRAQSRSPPSPPRRGSPVRFSQQSPSLSVRSASLVLSPSPSPPNASSPDRRGSPRARLLRPSRFSVSALSEVRSLEELFPEALGSLAELCPEALSSDDAISELSGASDGDFKINIMTLDDLVPATFGATERSKDNKKQTKVVTKHKAPAPRSLIEEISTEDQAPAEEEYESDFESEIRTETNRSASEVSEHLGGGGEKEDPSEVSEARDEVSVSDRSRRRNDSYSSQSDQSGHSRTQSYASRRDYSRNTESLSGRSSRVSYSRSSSFSSSSSTIIPPHSRRSKKSHVTSMREAAVQTQPDGLAYTWSTGMAALGPALGMAYVDPTPVASHTVSAEAVEALSAYSPAVFALNDMLRQQLSLTRHFVQASHHVHSSLLQSLGPADYTYTTLEDTKEFIRRNRPQKLTMEEALEEVLQEMREYHYI